MSFCTECGAEVMESARFCEECGHQVAVAVAAPASVRQSIPREQQVIVVRQEKSIGLAYILWVLLGQLGIHRFYLGKVGSGVAQLLLGVIGWATVWIIIGWIPLIILWIWDFIDLFLIPGMVREANAELHLP